LEDGLACFDDIQYVENANSKKIVGVELHSGKNRIVRRMFNHLDYRVEKLDRVCFAGLTKKNLSRGHYRFLTEKEVAFLKM
jgi:23S rRNA pseudouridine2605 synthase